MRQFTQTNRRLKFRCDAAGDDVLQLVGFNGVEEMSRPFLFRLQLISNSPSVVPADIVGTRVSFCIVMPDGAETERWFDGFVSRFSYRGTDDRSATSQYHAEVVSWNWFMGRTTDCRIFQDRTIPEIVKEVLGECPNASFDDSGVQSAYPSLEYCVQYRESDLDFVSRLLERAGIYYYFTHVEAQHKLILSDSKSGYVDCVESDATLHSTFKTASDEDLLLAWEHQAEFNSGAIASTDYNFKAPGTNLLTGVPTTMPFAGVSDYELFEYPGNYPTTSDGDKYTKVRMEEQEATHDVVHGRSRYCTYHCGGRFKVKEHYNPLEVGKSWVLLRVQHQAELGGSYITNSASGNGNGSGESEGASYSNDFICIPSETTFRPPRRTPRPVVGGLQTAVVVGAAGQEIQVDEFGRIRLEFFWDRYSHKKADASRWVRVSQSWAGPGYGTWFLPRVGNEVVVAFEDGDPDRPLCVGSVYHAENKNPYAQPGNKTQSGIKTRSTQGGGAGNFNEIKFEDKKGAEELYIQAEKDQSILVKHDRGEIVNHDRTLLVGHNKSETVGNDKSVHVSRDKTAKIDRNHTELIGGAMSITVAKTLTEMVGINYAETVGGAMELTVGAALAITVGAIMAETVAGAKTEAIGASKSEAIGGNRSMIVGGDVSENISKNLSTKVAKDVSIDVMGKHQEQVKKEYMLQAKKIQLVADDEISIKTGSAEIVMKKNGDITINGKKITVNGSGDVVIKGSKVTQN